MAYEQQAADLQAALEAHQAEHGTLGDFNITTSPAGVDVRLEGLRPSESANESLVKGYNMQRGRKAAVLSIDTVFAGPEFTLLTPRQQLSPENAGRMNAVENIGNRTIMQTNQHGLIPRDAVSVEFIEDPASGTATGIVHFNAKHLRRAAQSVSVEATTVQGNAAGAEVKKA